MLNHVVLYSYILLQLNSQDFRVRLSNFIEMEKKGEKVAYSSLPNIYLEECKEGVNRWILNKTTFNFLMSTALFVEEHELIVE